MTWNKTRCALAVFVLGSLLGAPWCLAAEKPVRQKTVVGWTEVWTQVRGGLIGLWDAYGCAVDPLGQCNASPAAAADLSSNAQELEVDRACGLDPYGRCLQ